MAILCRAAKNSLRGTIIKMVMNLLIFNYVNKMLLYYMNNNRKNFTTLMKVIDFLMLFFNQREA
jgi:hypothetical protein